MLRLALRAGVSPEPQPVSVQDIGDTGYRERKSAQRDRRLPRHE
jgi:hypothetical protein